MSEWLNQMYGYFLKQLVYELLFQDSKYCPTVYEIIIQYTKYSYSFQDSDLLILLLFVT